MTFRTYFFLLLVSAVAVLQLTAERKPNIIFIFIDDMGYGDLSSYGNEEFATTHIDRLAAEGLKFTQFYVNSPICSPSRVAVTTGMYPGRWRINSYIASRRRNARRGMEDFLDPAAPTLARTLKDAGYATAHFGKWHMGGGRDVDDAPLPRVYGFDESLVSFEGLGDRVLPPGGLSDQSAQLGNGKVRRVKKHELTGIYVDRAIDFLKRHKDQSVYINLWPNDIHDPFEPSEADLEVEDVAEFKDRERLRKYYAVLGALDREVGRLLEALKELGMEEETIVVLASDNGPTAWPHYYRDGGIAPGSSGGFRGRKWSLYEGGIREPLIARWPGKVPEGAVDRETVLAGFDLFPTLAALADVAVPPDADLDGKDMAEAFLGEPQERDAPLMWEYGRDDSYLRPGLEQDRSPNLAIREGDWKLLINADGTDMELYNLAEDPKETENLAEAHPERAKALAERVIAWRKALP